MLHSNRSLYILTETAIENTCPVGQRFIASTADNSEFEIVHTNDLKDTESQKAIFGSGTEYVKPGGDNIWIRRVNQEPFFVHSFTATVLNVSRVTMVLILNESKPVQLIVSI